jgi:hypothetical protein
MKNMNYVFVIVVLVTSGCSLFPMKDEKAVSAKPEPTITERLSGVMADLQQSEKIYLDKTVPSGTKYLILDKDELSSGMDWLGYALIENITENGGYSFATNYFLKNGKQPGLSVRLLNESPDFHWSFEKGANLNVDIGKALIGSVNFKDSYVYEFVISKIADFSVDKSAFDDAGFNATIFSLYLTSLSENEKAKPSGYDSFKKTYGVARGGSLYEVIVNEYKSTTIDGEADIVGLVKAKGGFYKKTGGGGKKIIFKLFYANAGHIDTARFEQATKVRETLRTVNQSDVANAIRNPSASVNDAVSNAAVGANQSLRAIFSF